MYIYEFLILSRIETGSVSRRMHLERMYLSQPLGGRKYESNYCDRLVCRNCSTDYAARWL